MITKRETGVVLERHNKGIKTFSLLKRTNTLEERKIWQIKKSVRETIEEYKQSTICTEQFYKI